MCMNLYRNINRKKIQFDFVKHSQKEGAFEEEIRKLGGKIYTAPKYKIYNHMSYCRWWKNFFNTHPEYQIIHGHYFSISSVYFKIAKQYNKITIAHSHASQPKGKSWKERYKRFLCRKLESVSDYCFACGEEAGKWLFPHKDFTILRNGIDLQQFRFDLNLRSKMRKNFGIQEKDFVLGTVGSMQKIKNPFFLIEIFKAIHDRDPDTRFIWVGDGGLRNEILSLIEKYHLQDSMILTGVRSDVSDILQAMDVFLLPSLSEGLGMCLIEAQSEGLPCFCSEFVPKEVDITGLCRFLSINSVEIWENEILKMKNFKRKDTLVKIKEAGYDVRDTAKYMEEFYLSVYKSMISDEAE